MKNEKKQTVEKFPCTIRPYSPKDREKVRALCCDTGYLGKPVENIFQDRKWFADFNTDYYLKHEPDSCFVAEADNDIVGYIVGCKHALKYSLIFYPLIAVPHMLQAFLKCLLRTYGEKSREYIKRLVLIGGRERVKRPKGTAHFHINVKKEYRKRGVAISLVRALFKHFWQNNVEHVHAELFYPEKVRAERFYSYYGLKTYEKKPTTILGSEMGKVYMMTVVTNLRELKDFWKL